MRISGHTERRSKKDLPVGGPPRATASFERYAITAELASGGMGVVYRAVDRSTGQARALKRIHRRALEDPALVEAFEREYQVLAGIDHPRIIRVFDYGVDEGGPYYTMELLEGQDMRTSAPLPVHEACVYLRDVATSLSLLHARRLIHRDLSPANVRKTSDGHCKLLDFGALAAFGPSSQVVGTAPATPHEALMGAPLDQRSDLYSLGALGYFLLTGRHAYPAERFEDLIEVWSQTPRPPSDFAPEVSTELDALIMGMLSPDPLARPASAAEVIARLGTVAMLGADGDDEPERLAQLFLASPAFVGRTEQLADLGARAVDAVEGRGSGVLVEAIAGMGRTRFLVEVAVRAQLAGATVLTVDASVHTGPLGVARALALRALEALPDAAIAAAATHPAALLGLGRDVAHRMGVRGSVAAANEDSAVALESWFFEMARAKPLVAQVDNVEYADGQSLGVLSTLAKLAPDYPLLLVVTERMHHDAPRSDALVALRGACTTLALSGLDPEETRAFARSLFGDPPGMERFAPWLHEWTAGSPLHASEVARQLVREGVVRYVDGVWILPTDRPRTQFPPKLEGALTFRISTLGDRARALAECLCLGRRAPTLALCRALLSGADDRDVLLLLDELVRNEVLDTDRGGYRFSSTTLRDALLAGMDDLGREQTHRRLGEALARLGSSDDLALRIEAGFHLIEGNDQLRGAEMIASATHNSVAIRNLNANVYYVGRPIEAALLVYKRHRRSLYERMPLLAALAQAGFYEALEWGERYGDEALDALEEISGLRDARRFARVVGKSLGLLLGILVAVVRFRLTPASERGYSFAQVMVQLFGTVTTLAAAAAQSFDPDRADRVAEVLSPFSRLPSRLTPVGIYEMCRAVARVGREEEAATFAVFETLRARFADPRFYPTLPAEARRLYVAAADFARGTLAVVRADGRVALQAADRLDETGLKLYAMVASQLRYLYHMNRGEHALAAPHRERVGLHAAHAGSAWQVEAWEASALIPVSTATSDVVSLTRIVDRLDELSQTMPALRLHGRVTRLALMLAQHTSVESTISAALRELEGRPPRSFMGWACSYGFVARGYNETGEHEKAAALCDSVISNMTDADREYVTLFLIIDIELAVAHAGLGRVDEALDRVDGLLRRFADSNHPWVLGRLHETRARIAAGVGNHVEYERSRMLMDAQYRATGTPALIARCERVAELAVFKSSPRSTTAPPAMTDAERNAHTQRADVSGRRN